MFYVMELGPLEGGVWMSFSVDEKHQVHLAAAESRELARRDLVEHLSGRAAQCCESLREFGRAHGWTAAPPPEVAKNLAAAMSVGVEVAPAFDGMLPPAAMLDAWLRATAMFLTARPCGQLDENVDLDARFNGPGLYEQRVISVLRTDHQVALLISPSRDVHTARAQNGFPPDCLVVSVVRDASATSAAVHEAHGLPFSIRVTRFREGAAAFADELDLEIIIGSLAAIASLCSPDREFGRATIDGVETIVRRLGSEKPALAN